MEILKSKLEVLFKDLPDKVDIDEFMYRIYLLQKIEEGEKDIKEGRILSHKEAAERLSDKWEN
ncbi:MAG: hypothetical protein ACK415_12910 [Thermodesulfovibrionales bacterium]